MPQVEPISVRVKSVAELRDAAETSGNYVCIDSSLAGETLTLTNSIVPAENVTIDGSEAPGLELFNPGGFVSLRGTVDNLIVHSLFLSADPAIQTTAIVLLHGENFWFDRITLSNFESDDGFGIGNSNAERRVRYVTISNLRTHSNNFGSIDIESYPKDMRNGETPGYVTVHSSWMQSQQRTIKNDGGRNVHAFNNYIDGVRFSHMDVANDNNLVNANIQTLSESNHYTNSGGTNRCAERTKGGGFIFTDGKSRYDGDYEQCGDVIAPGMGGFNPDVPDYSYEILTTNQVEATIKANSGAF